MAILPKAYSVSDKYGDSNYYIVYAESRGKAIRYALQNCDDAFGDYTFTEMRAIRKPKLDLYYHGASELEWDNMDDRLVMVRDASFYCSYEMDITTDECEDCKAHEWCYRYEQMINGTWRYF